MVKNENIVPEAQPAEICSQAIDQEALLSDA